MPRPRICRRVRFRPNVTYFKPAGVRMVDLNEIILTIDEYEAVRLIDLESIGNVIPFSVTKVIDIFLAVIF